MKACSVPGMCSLVGAVLGAGLPLAGAQCPINTQHTALAVRLAAGGLGPSSGRECTASEYSCGLSSVGASY